MLIGMLSATLWPNCLQVESVRKKHYMSVYLTDPSTFALEDACDDAGEDGACS